jgi:hypothetical protein
VTAVYRRAAAILADRGFHQGDLIDPDTGAVDVLGACLLADGIVPDDPTVGSLERGEAVGRYARRLAPFVTPNESHDPAKVAHTIAVATAGAHLGGASTSFDAGVLDRFLRRHGYVPAWHHRPIDVEERAAGQFGWDTPRGLKDTAFHVGLHVDEEQTHTALYDAELARAVYARLMYRAATLAPADLDVADDDGGDEEGDEPC